MSTLTGIFTADWHLDRFNRLDDMSRCVDFAIDEAIRRKVDVFILGGDGYRTWHPAPIEMSVMHRIVRLVQAGIKVYVLVGNHDWPESDAYRGAHCFTEMRSLGSGIVVVDTVFHETVNGVLLAFIPHIPKSVLVKNGKTYGQAFSEAVGALSSVPSSGGRLLFTHAYMREAAVGPNDLMVENDKQITLEQVIDPRLTGVFLGDIHKHQVLRKERPTVLYPGSLDRVDFGEAKDPKGIVAFKMDAGALSWEFVRTPARRFEHLELDLSKVAPADVPSEVLRIIGMTDVMDAVVKVTVRCTAEQKAELDDESVRGILAVAGADKVRSVNYEMPEVRVLRAPEIGEHLTPADALSKWVGMQTYAADRGPSVVEAGRRLIEAR